MRREVQWTRPALDDIKDQIAYIEKRSPAAARRIAARLRTEGDRLGEMEVGHPGRATGTFEKTVRALPYIIAYAIRTDSSGRKILTILRVIHGRRNWPSGSWPT